MQITSINQTNNNTPNFNGMTKILKKRIYIDGKKDIGLILQEKNPKNTYAGELPPVIFYALPKEKRTENIQKIYKTFDEVSDEIREFKPGINSPRDEYINRRPQSAVDKLKNMFVELGMIKKEDNFDIKYLGAGEYKKAFKLEGIKDKKTGEELTLGVFHLVDKTPEWHKYKSHGNFAEINISTYWKKRHGQETQRGKFYWGDINHGYFVSKFIDRNVKPAKKHINEYNDGLKLTDEVMCDTGHNKLYGYSIDPGGVRVVNRIKNESKIAQRVQTHIKNTPLQFREQEWYKHRYSEKKGDKKQIQAGLALCIKHLPNKEKHVEECLSFNNPLADTGIGYALKYLPEDSAKKYFEILMKRKNPTTQTVLLNEIPLLSRTRQAQKNIDDLDVPKGEIRSDKIEEYYKIAEKHVLPEVEEHLASYLHLLPKDKIMPEADKLIAKGNYHINDRLLHKIKFVKDEEYSFGDKMEVLGKLDKVEKNDFLKSKISTVRTQIIRNQLDD